MEKILYFDCFSGISGNMILGALLDIGLSKEKLQKALATLPLGGYNLSVTTVTRGGLRGKWVNVEVDQGAQPERTFETISQMIQRSDLDPRSKELSLSIFERLARAEGKIHNRPAEQVHFHEVGAVDSIVDIVGTAIGISHLDVPRCYASALPLGSGSVKTRHGELPLPAPATLEILQGVPVYQARCSGETVTPTGAAILATLVCEFGEMPTMLLETVGYGVGDREGTGLPNILRVVQGSREAAGPGLETCAFIQANIDDMNPELFGYLMERLFEGGALDVSFQPVQMKKNRPGTVLSVIAPFGLREKLMEIVLRESTSIGVRWNPVERLTLPRIIKEVETPYGTIRVKVSRDDQGGVNVAPEYEDCKRLAGEKGVSLKEIYRMVFQHAEVLKEDIS